ncbi:hypothetical protein EIP91_009350 [Steccherinum ochraceum]|uniref:Uncharacterized protein n=1 Tax=Steccherinum ochraceum TaxID=92696 RepID=A0A4R0RJX1_9APHY|nr:hypothetical protein EIP91_009350 [Steccherinum ochraceum]
MKFTLFAILALVAVVSGLPTTTIHTKRDETGHLVCYRSDVRISISILTLALLSSFPASGVLC